MEVKKEERGEEEVGEERRKVASTLKEERLKTAFEGKVPEGIVEVPIVKLEKPSVKVCRLGFSDEIPEVVGGKLDVIIPFLNLQEKPPTTIPGKLNDEILRLEREERKVVIPFIKLDFPIKAQVLQGFDEEIRRIEEVKLKPIVPSFRKESFYLKSCLRSFDLTIDEKIVRLERMEEKEFEEGGGAESTGGGEEIPDFLEFAFGGGGGIRGGGPKIILFKDLENDSYVGFLENICLRIYREGEDGEPKAVKIRKMDDMNKRMVEELLKAGGRIFTIDLDKEEKMPDETHLWERLEETYTEKLGFIIFTVRGSEKFERLRELMQRINKKAQGSLNIIELEARKLPLELIELSSGMIGLEKLSGGVEVDKISTIRVEVDGKPTATTFDYIFNKALFNEGSLFNEALEDVKREERGLFKESTNPAEETESSLHFNIKVFLVRYLVHELRRKGEKLSTREEILKRIKTEKELAAKVVPDVMVGDEVYEVETLFGPHAGGEPDLKINRTVDKYDGTSIAKVNIVMDNFGFLLHMKDLFRKKEYFKGKRFNVEFYTLDLQNKRLISLSDFAEKFKQCLSSINKKSNSSHVILQNSRYEDLKKIEKQL